MKRYSPLTPTILLAALIAGVGMPQLADAGNYGISPLDFQLTTQRKSGVLTITNEDTAPIALRVRAMRWTQGQEGEDIYEESTDLVFFPKRIDLKPGEKKIVRLGVNAVQQDRERAYRLFVDELPPPEDPTQRAGTRLAVLVSMGVPVFLTPEGAQPQLKVEQAQLGDGLNMTVSNAGAARIRMSRIVASDGSELAQNIPGRYVFPGIRKNVRIPVAARACSGKELPLRVDTDGVMTDFDAVCTR
jgi:fimbrial chaperone protein